MHKGFILLNCDLGAEEYIADELKQMQNVGDAYLTFGAYDVIAEIQRIIKKDLKKQLQKLENSQELLVQ